jgi:hypothetical protein
MHFPEQEGENQTKVDTPVALQSQDNKALNLKLPHTTWTIWNIEKCFKYKLKALFYVVQPSISLRAFSENWCISIWTPSKVEVMSDRFFFFFCHNLHFIRVGGRNVFNLFFLPTAFPSLLIVSPFSHLGVFQYLATPSCGASHRSLRFKFQF